MNCHAHTLQRADRHAALVLPAVRRRPGRDGAWARCWQVPRPARRPRPADPLAPEAAALSGQGQARHLPVHGRRAQPSGAVRLQAGAGQVRRPAAAGRAAQGLPGRVHQSELEASWRPKFKFARHGQCGRRAVRAAAAPGRRSSTTSRIVRSLVTDAFNHAPGQILMNTGSQQFGRPSIGAWATYGLGSESRRPARLRRVELGQEGHQRRHRRTGAAAFCRPSYQGVPFRSQGDPVLYLSNPPGIDRADAARLARRARAAQPPCGSTAWAIRRSPRGSTPSRWPTACRPARRS